MSLNQRMETDTSVILSITGWTNSKAANDADGGQASLEGWLSRKAKRTIQASQRSDDVLQIQVLDKDKRSFLHVDGWVWAGVNVKITEGQPDPTQLSRAPHQQRGGFTSNQPRQQRGGFNPDQPRNSDLSSRISSGPNNNQNRNQSKELFGHAPSGPRGGGFQQNRQSNAQRGGAFQQNRQPSGKPTHNPFDQTTSNPFDQNKGVASQPPVDQLTQTLIQVIRNRYHANEKFLDLGALATDPTIQTANLESATVEKVFGAIFVCLEKHVFETREKRADMIQSVSFKNNGLSTVKTIIGAGSTFYKIKNLDLSDNHFQKITDISWWKNRFPDLEHIILAGNPVDSPQTREEVKKWYRNLKIYNLQPLDAPFNISLQPLGTTPPVPTQSPAPVAALNGQLLDTKDHPEFPEGSTFGLPLPGKSEEQLIMEQMGLKFSYETGLKIILTEECLRTNGWDYQKAMDALNIAMSSGNIPADSFVGGTDAFITT